MKTRKFWPLDYDPEGAIYENIAWDLPGFRRPPRPRASRGQELDLKKRRS